MRKILLGTTAVVGAALLAPEMAAAQQAPTVRIGGYFRAYYGNIQQTSPNVTGNLGGALTTIPGTTTPTIIGGQNVIQAQQIGDSGITGTIPFNQVGATAGTVSAAAFALPNAGTAAAASQSARIGHNDFSTDTEVHVFVNGKLANGLTYGSVVEIEFDNNEGTYRAARRSYTQKTMATIDEMYAFVATPRFGQIRFGDEDGPFGGLLNAGFVTNFGTGGIYGEWESFVIRPNRTTTSPGSVLDNTKVIYLSPQLFGFDFGVSFAFNEGTGEDTGCISSFAGPYCDRAYAAQGATAFGRATPDLPGRRDELQAMLRWRGSVGPVGLAVSGGTMLSDVVNDITVQGTQVKTLRSPEVYQVGLQATALGFTLGGNFMWGNTNFFYIPTPIGDKRMQQFFVGGSYVAGPFSIGANGFWGNYAGQQGFGFNTTSGNYFSSTSRQGQRRFGYAVGANYRLAPGLDLVAEYIHHEISENGADLDGQGNNGVQDRLEADVILIGTRLAF